MEKGKKEERIYQKEEDIRQMSHLIGAMAHQWKQPLNILGLLIQDVKDAYEYNELDKAYLEEFAQRGMDNVRKISTSIDSYRSFFTPKFKSEQIDVAPALNEIVAMLSHQYQNHKISLDVNGESFTVTLYLNSFRQAVMNILGTIKDRYDTLEQCERKIDIRMDAALRQIRISESCGVLDFPLVEKILSKEPPALMTLGAHAPLLNAKEFLQDAADATLTVEKKEKAISFIITFP